MSGSRRFSTVLITGASSGLGEEYALQLAGRADRLVLAARRKDLLEALAARMLSAHPGLKVTVMAADLSKPDDRVALLDQLATEGLVPDFLVNNAGLGDHGEFTTAAWPKLEAMLRVNVEALTHMAHLLVPGMIRLGGGVIINVSSLASLLPIPDFAVYAASKAYVTSFSEALRIELREHGVEVLAVCPGPVHTEFGLVARREKHLPGIPARESFYVPREQVVAESLTALERKKARVYPGMKISAAAMLMSTLPMVLMRAVMSRRPRRNG
jgi:short-subunit dehydrogenase